MGPLNNPKAIADELAILNHPLTAEERLSGSSWNFATAIL